MNSALVKGIAKYAVGFALLGWVVYANRDGLAEALRQPVQPLPLALAVVITAAATFLTFVRWFVLARSLHLPLEPGPALRLCLIGYFYNTFLPGSIGGDAVKMFYLARTQERRTAAVATVVFDRLVGLWALVALVALLGAVFWLRGDSALFANPKLLTIVYSAWLGTLVTLAGWLLLGLTSDERAERFAGRLGRTPKLGHALAEVWRATWVFHRQSAVVAVVVLMSLIGHVGFVLGFHFAAQIFHDPADPGGLPSLTEHFLIVPLGMVIKAVFPAPGGLGGGEFGYGKLYRMVGRPEAAGILGSLGLTAVGWSLGMVGYLVHLVWGEAPPAEA